ncbi:MAG: peptidase domain-containing ABC transporter [Chitinophagales bacterium]|nr:peptidase domain-containing ABC transporter [Chitinophagales bacterium]
MNKFFHQHDSTDCGPTCLRIISNYYGKDFPLEYLREKSFIGKDGVSLLNTKVLAEALGFETVSIKADINTLINEQPLPCILHWNQNHFVVLYKIKKNYFNNNYSFYLADPAHGKAILKQQEFEKAWLSTDNKGVALLMQPTNQFYENEDLIVQNKGFSFLWKYLHPNKSQLFALLLFTFLAGIVALTFPFITQFIMDKGIKPKNIPFITSLLFAQFALLIGQSIFNLIRNSLILKINTNISIQIISDFLTKLTKLSIPFFDSKSVGDINQRIVDHERIEFFLTHNLVSTIFGLFNFVIFSAILIYYNVSYFLIFLLGSIFSVIWIILFLKKRKAIDYQRFQVQQQNQDAVFEIISGMQEIKLNNAEQLKVSEWEKVQQHLFKINLKGLNIEQLQNIGSFTITQIKNILLLYLAAKQVVFNEITLGVMMSISYIIGQMNAPLEQLIEFFKEGQDARISLDRMSEVHNHSNETAINQVALLQEKSTITLNNVSFQYEGKYSPYILRNLNLQIPQGKVTAIVGASGSGKTTLLKLLLKFYNVTEGNIYVNNQDLEEINPNNWRNYCGTVMQDGFIFSDTIERNINLSDENIDKQRLYNACKIANILDFIESLPLGFNTKIGGTGLGVSIGQKQRILIARAVYKNPQFLFFDEATSALDANNEKEITNNLEAFFKDKTVVIVAHRLSTVKNADQIIVLDNGTVVEQGTHQELIRNKSHYYNLISNQLELGV